MTEDDDGVDIVEPVLPRTVRGRLWLVLVLVFATLLVLGTIYGPLFYAGALALAILVLIGAVTWWVIDGE